MTPEEAADLARLCDRIAKLTADRNDRIRQAFLDRHEPGHIGVAAIAAAARLTGPGVRHIAKTDPTKENPT